MNTNEATRLIAEAAPKVWDFLRAYMESEGGPLEVHSADVVGDMVLEAFPSVAEAEPRLAFFDLREFDEAAVEKAVRSAFPEKEYR